MQKFIFIILLLFITNVSWSTPLLTPAGFWVARSPFFGNKPIGVVKIYISHGELCGELIKVLPLNGKIESAFQKNHVINGPIVMCNYHLSGDKWVDGKIFDPATALVVRSELEMDRDNNHISITGWLGPVSQTAIWDRVGEKTIE